MPPKPIVSPANRTQALCQEAVALQNLGKVEEARAIYKKVLLRDAKHFVALHGLGILSVQEGQAELGAALLSRAVRSEPRVPDARNSLALAFLAQRRWGEALASLDKAIDLRPDFAEAHHNRGLALRGMGRLEDAVAAFDRAVALRPAYAKALVNRGSVLQEMGNFPTALASVDRAIALDPTVPEAHNNRGMALDALGRPADAITAYDRAVALAPRYADAFLNRAVARLTVGQWADGWRDYEWRDAVVERGVQALDASRSWRGEPDLNGRRLLLLTEQGLGDIIQFARYIPLVEAQGMAVDVAAPLSLHDLLRRISPTCRLFPTDGLPAEIDWHCPLMSLPLALGTRIETIPPPPSVSLVDEVRRAAFEVVLGPKTRPRVGIAWSGNPDHQRDRQRSIPFGTLIPMLCEDVQWVAVQNQVRDSDAAAFHDFGKVSFHGEQLRDFTDTAALIDLLDLVIAVDTSVVHVAGSMGKSTWVLLPFRADWRWRLNRRDSPWYPSARLFRQARAGDWAGVLTEVTAELSAYFSPV